MVSVSCGTQRSQPLALLIIFCFHFGVSYLQLQHICTAQVTRVLWSCCLITERKLKLWMFITIRHWSWVFITVIIQNLYNNMVRRKDWYKSQLFLGFENIAELLITRGAAVNYIGLVGETALIKAAEKGEWYVFTMLCSLPRFDHFFELLLFCIKLCQRKRVRTIKHIEKLLAKIFFNHFPIGYLKVVKMLIERDANLNAVNDDGNSPITVAAKKGEIPNKPSFNWNCLSDLTKRLSDNDENVKSTM